MSGETKKLELTDLDEALEAARQNPSAANYFYDSFLNAVLFIPVLREGKEKGSWEKVASQDHFRPMFVSHKGTRLVPGFDRIEKLKFWAADRDLDYLEVRAHVFIQLIIGDGTSLVINPGTPWNYEFTHEMLESLRKAMRPVSLN